MADDAQTQTIRSINWRDVFPFTHLFRAFRIAVHPSKLLLALVALLLIYLGGRVLDGAWPRDYKLTDRDEIGRYVASTRTTGDPLYKPPPPRPDYPRYGIFITFFEYEYRQVFAVIGNAVALKWYDAFESAWDFLVSGPRWLFHRHPVFGALFM